jgi:hypothetical protein
MNHDDNTTVIVMPLEPGDRAARDREVIRQTVGSILELITAKPRSIRTFLRNLEAAGSEVTQGFCAEIIDRVNRGLAMPTPSPETIKELERAARWEVTT